MKIFITKTFILALILIPIVVGWHYALDNYYNLKSSENSLFIWGDSQAYHGINLDVLSKASGKKVFTAARNGAGIYDFLVFSEKVPNNSNVIITLSKPVQIRRKERDRNISGISISSLYHLLNNSYSLGSLCWIISKNTRPTRLFLTKTNLFKYDETTSIRKPSSSFKNLYNEIPNYLKDKQNLFLIGLKRIVDKKCKIRLIELPYHKFVHPIENKSPIKQKTISFSNAARQLVKCQNVDTLKLDRSRQVMHDLTHLNEVGADQVSRYIGRDIKMNERTTMYIVH
jgi:hypothetical protein